MMVDETAPNEGTCPSWCVEAHDPRQLCEALVHVGEPVYLSSGISARLCMSVDGLGHVEEGPFVLVGEEEFTLQEAFALGTSLVAMAQLDPSPQAPSGAESPQRG